MDICALEFFLGNISLVLAFIACILPMVIGRQIRSTLDPEFYNDHFFNLDYEKSIPFHHHRRAMVYLAAIGVNRLSRHRFQGVELERKVSPAMKGLGFLEFIALFGGFGLAMVYGVIRFLICG